MFQKSSLILLMSFCLSVCCNAVGHTALAADRAAAQYLSTQQPSSTDRALGQYRSTERRYVQPLPPHRGREQYIAPPITKAGASREDDRYYYLSKEDERYLDRALRNNPPSRTIRLPSGMVIQFNMTYNPHTQTTYTPVKPLMVLP